MPMNALATPSRASPTATLAAAPPGAFWNAGASIKPVPVTVGTKSIKRSPTQTTSAMPVLLRPEEEVRGPSPGPRVRSARAGPALVLGDVLARDQARGHQDHRLL